MSAQVLTLSLFKKKKKKVLTLSLASTKFTSRFEICDFTATVINSSN